MASDFAVVSTQTCYQYLLSVLRYFCLLDKEMWRMSRNLQKKFCLYRTSAKMANTLKIFGKHLYSKRYTSEVKRFSHFCISLERHLVVEC